MSGTDGFVGGTMSESPGALGPMHPVPAGARLVLATANPHKVDELRQILGGQVPGLAPEAIVGLAELGLESPEETGVTLEQNSLLKARAVVQQVGLPAVADDSGILVDVLGGAPGVFSARWSGVHGDDVANLDLLLAQLQDVPSHHRGARFACVAALVTPEGQTYLERAEVKGVLTAAPRGEGGFGYDPIFVPEGYSRTMAELTPQEKNSISHRGQAIRQLTDEIAAVLSRS